MMLRSLGLGAAALTACMAIGCGDSAAPDPVGSLYFNRTSASSADTPAGKHCPITPKAIQIGTVPPTTQSPGRPVTNGDGASVSCSVGDGDPVKISGNMTKGPVQFVVEGSVQKGGQGTATILEYDPDSLTTLKSPTDLPCDLFLDSPKLTAGGSKMWVRFRCRGLESPSQPDVFCAADDTSVFYFDHCD